MFDNWSNLNDSISNKSISIYVSINAAKGLHEIVKSNLGPHGTFKILVSPIGDIKLTKNGNILLKEMQIQNPVASLIAKLISAQNIYFGDGTTSIILILGDLIKRVEKYLEKGIHAQILCEGINIGRRELEKWFPSQIINYKNKKKELTKIAKAIFCTKFRSTVAFKIAKIAVEALLTIKKKDEVFDINLIEIISMHSKTTS